MDKLVGSFVDPFGSLCLRFVQTTFGCASLVLAVDGGEFYRYSAFCYLIIVMIVVINWNFTLALIEVYSMMVQSPIPQSDKSLIIAAVDWVLSILALAAACSSDSAVDVLSNADASYCSPKCSSRYESSAGLAFIIWILSVQSSLCNLWLLPSFLRP